MRLSTFEAKIDMLTLVALQDNFTAFLLRLFYPFGSVEEGYGKHRIMTDTHFPVRFKWATFCVLVCMNTTACLS